MKADKIRHRVERQGSPTLRNWDSPKRVKGKPLANEATVDCGWGKLIFAHTFDDNRRLADAICDEKPEQRNIALYIKDPHVVLALKPHDLFLDPSHTYRLWLHTYRASRVLPRGFRVRRAQGRRRRESDRPPACKPQHGAAGRELHPLADHVESADAFRRRG